MINKFFLNPTQSEQKIYKIIEFAKESLKVLIKINFLKNNDKKANPCSIEQKIHKTIEFAKETLNMLIKMKFSK